jgi:hypothetical protein
MLQIEPQDREHFIDACVQLIGSVEDLEWQSRLTAVFSVCARWQNAGRELPWNINVALFGVIVRIVLQHMYQGFPLALPMVVLAAFVAAGDALETPLFECAACGYALPRSFATCPLCGGQVGLGAYGLRRSRLAGRN